MSGKENLHKSKSIDYPGYHSYLVYFILDSLEISIAEVYF